MQLYSTHPSPEVCHPHCYREARPHGLCSDWVWKDGEQEELEDTIIYANMQGNGFDTGFDLVPSVWSN